MILTCPECATSYFVDDSRIVQTGRTVKCTSCGARWTARRETSEVEHPPAPTPFRPELSKIVPADLEVVAVLPQTTPPAADVAPEGPARLDRVKTEAAGRVAIWVVSAAAIAALVTGAIVFRGAVVRRVPASQVAYAGLGLSVNATGLLIEDVKAQPTFQVGRPALSVTGTIRNERDTVATAPALRVNLLNAAGKPLAVQVARPLDAAIPGHAVRHFAIAVLDPPAGVQDLEVVFEANRRATKPAKAQPLRAAEAVLVPTPTTSEAQPLVPGSPDALPKDATTKHD